MTLRQDVAKRLRKSRASGESYSDVLNRLLDNQPASSVGEWMESLAPLEGRSLFTREGRAALKKDQRNPRSSAARRRPGAAP